MRRREFIALLGGAAAWPSVAGAQERTLPVIGFLYAGSSGSFTARLDAFRQGLREGGYIEGQNVSIEYRWGEGHYERLQGLAADLVQRKVSVIAAVGTEAPAKAAKRATSTIPIVFQIGGDPVTAELVSSLNHPGGNITGVTRMTVETLTKSLELLRSIVPNAAPIGVLVNPLNLATKQSLENIQAAGRSLGIQRIEVLNASSDPEIEAAIETAVQRRVGAIFINTDSFFNSHTGQLAILTRNHVIPTLYSTREFVAAGGLISYGASLLDQYRQVGVYVARILKGEKPADLPVMQPTRFELAINMKTAKELRLTLPPSLLATADEVIE